MAMSDKYFIVIELSFSRDYYLWHRQSQLLIPKLTELDSLKFGQDDFKRL